jgi:CheY-like chemotaxis protein
MARRVLIVDDDAASREAMAALLRDCGYEMLTAGDVPGALQLLRERQPDLLITDVRLHSYNGLHLIAMAPRPIPAIVVTGFADACIEADARRLGAEYRVKPVDPAALRVLVAKLLERAKPAVFTSTRRASRQRLGTPVSVRIGQRPGRVVEVSAIGVGLEVDSAGDATLADSVALRIAALGTAVPIRVAWKRRQDPRTVVCGATIAAEDHARWQAFIKTLR